LLGLSVPVIWDLWAIYIYISTMDPGQSDSSGQTGWALKLLTKLVASKLYPWLGLVMQSIG